MPEKRAVLFANGELKHPDRAITLLRADDFLIAVDGGLNHLEALGFTPRLLIGDLDSVTPDQVQRAQATGGEIRRYPPAKDETDLELALLAARELGYREIVGVAALGGRLDQTLGNLSLLLLPELTDCAVRCEDGSEEVFIIRDSTEIHGRPGDVVSIPPGEKHWHGATTTTAMTHIAIQENLDGKAVEWMEKVSDEQYLK